MANNVMALMDDCILNQSSNGSSFNWTEDDLLVYQEDCVKNQLQLLEDALVIKLRLKPWENALFYVAYSLISFLGLFGNGLVIAAVIRKKDMRTNRNVFITNLALSNFLLSLLAIPFLWYPSTTFHFPYNRFVCKLVNAMPGSNIFCSTLTISVMAMDRYFAVVQSRRISEKIGVAVAVAVGIWLLSMAIASPCIVFYDIIDFVTFPDLSMHPSGQQRTWGLPICDLAPGYPPKIKQIISGVIGLIQLLFLCVIPLIVLLFFNYRLSHYLQQHTVALSANCNHNRSREPSSVPAGRAAISAARRTSRTTHLLIAMAVSYAILWLPFTLTSLAYDFNIYSTGARIDYTVKLLSLVSICVNPLLYGYLNTNFNREFREILASVPLLDCCIRWLQSCKPESDNISTTRSTRRMSLTSVLFQRRRDNSQIPENSQMFEEEEVGPLLLTSKTSEPQQQGSSTRNGGPFLQVPSRHTHRV